MNYTHSSESDSHAGVNVTIASVLVEQYLNTAIPISSVSDLDATLRYTPIIMPEDSLDDYPARSELREMQNLYACSPQLSFDVFVTGALDELLKEYLSGPTEVMPYLTKLGASIDQVNEFEDILNNAIPRILAGDFINTITKDELEKHLSSFEELSPAQPDYKTLKLLGFITDDDDIVLRRTDADIETEKDNIKEFVRIMAIAGSYS